MRIKKSDWTFIYTLSDDKDKIRYIGKADNPKGRLSSHISEAKRNNKSHKDRWILKCLNQNFKPKLKILQMVLQSESKEREKYWISYGKAKGWNLTNLTDGGEGLIGYSHSEETKIKLSLANIGKKLSADTINKIILANTGKKRSAEFCEQVRKNNTGRKMSPEAIEKLRLSKLGSIPWNKGKTASVETKIKIGLASKGRKCSPETRLKLSLKSRGHITSEETKLKISIANTGRKHTKESIQKMREVKTVKKLARAIKKVI